MLLIDGFRNLLSEDHKMLPDIYLFMSEVIFRGAVVAVSGGQCVVFCKEGIDASVSSNVVASFLFSQHFVCLFRNHARTRLLIRFDRFKEALSLLRDANFPMEEGKRFARDRVDVLDELKILEQDVFYQTCAAESLQACALGKFLLPKLCSSHACHLGPTETTRQNAAVRETPHPQLWFTPIKVLFM